MPARRTTRVLAALVTTAAFALVAAPGASAAPAASAPAAAERGTRSLAAVLARDSGFDRNPWDFDIVEGAVKAVLAAKPTSPVAVLADGNVALTAFLPNDYAFALLAKDITGKRYRSEAATLSAIAGAVGIDTVEAVLLYHVVPGATISYRAALGADGAGLATALGSKITVDVRFGSFVQLIDKDRDDYNPWVVRPNINSGNKQIAHGISHVLRPVNI